MKFSAKVLLYLFLVFIDVKIIFTFTQRGPYIFHNGSISHSLLKPESFINLWFSFISCFEKISGKLTLADEERTTLACILRILLAQKESKERNTAVRKEKLLCLCTINKEGGACRQNLLNNTIRSYSLSFLLSCVHVHR